MKMKSNMRKCMNLIFVFVLLIMSIVSPKIKVEAKTNIASSYAGGNGTKSKPYKIAKPSQLKLLAKMTNAGKNYKDTYFILTADLDMENESWVPIGNKQNPFMGIFNGNNHTISCLHYNSKGVYQGLFGYVSDVKISNLNVSFSDLGTGDDDSQYIGGICGYIKNGSITNCSSNLNNIYGTYVGGIAGLAEDTTIKECYNTSTIKNYDLNAGGIIGSGTNIYISNCYNTGLIYDDCGGTNYAKCGGIAGEMVGGTIEYSYNSGSIESTGGEYLRGFGGIVGRLESNKSKTIIQYCYNTADLITRCSMVGGIVGSASSGFIQDCHNLGKIQGYNRAGGIAGELSGSITNSYNKGYINGAVQIGGIVGNLYGAIDSCSNYGIVNGNQLDTYSGGIAAYALRSQIKNCFNTADILYGSGILDSGSQATVSNCYNNAYAAKAGIIGENWSGKVENCYYDIDVASTGIKSGDAGSASPELAKTMKSSKFTKMLNTSNSTTWIYDKNKNNGYPMPIGLASTVSKPIFFKVSQADKKASIKWKEVDGASYIIYRYNAKTKKYEKIKTITKSSSTSYTDKGLTNGKTYKYKMVAYKEFAGKKYYSEYTSVKSITIK